MNTKDFLRRYRTVNQYIDCKLEEIAQLRALATRISPAERSDRGGNTSDKVGKTVAKIVDLEREVDRQIDELVRIRSEIEKTITAVKDERQRTILTKRYINGDKWEKIAVDLSIDLRWVYILHGKALQQIKIHH